MEQPMATIVLHRRPNVVQPLWVYTVEIDGSPAARLAVSQHEAIAVLPGRHRVQAKALLWSSPSLEVDVEPGSTLTVEIGPDVKHMWNMVVHPRSFLHVEAGSRVAA
jgi:hypothetical protein